MQTLKVLDSKTIPGSVNTPNEDKYACNGVCVAVVDGATGLGDRQITDPNGSDAAWFSNAAGQWFEREICAGCDPADVVDQLISDCREQFLRASGTSKVPRYAWPSASFAMIFLDELSLSFIGLGDCVAYVKIGQNVERYCALPAFGESENLGAAKHIRRVGGFKDQQNLLSEDETLEHLRSERSKQNTKESGVWTLGLENEAVQHMVQTPIIGAKPECILVCSDGFSALVETYARYTPEALLDAALSKGLQALMVELRDIENNIDPNGETFPRYKRSDDATAVLCKLSD